jgi:hypothetical protein
MPSKTIDYAFKVDDCESVDALPDYHKKEIMGQPVIVVNLESEARAAGIEEPEVWRRAWRTTDLLRALQVKTVRSSHFDDGETDVAYVTRRSSFIPEKKYLPSLASLAARGVVDPKLAIKAAFVHGRNHERSKQVEITVEKKEKPAHATKRLSMWKKVLYAIRW